MFAILKHFYELLTRKDQYKLLIIGLDNAGKTTCLEQFRLLFDKSIRPNEGLPPIAPTIGFNLTRFECEYGEIIIWDVGGQTGLRAIWDNYYAEANALIYVVDASDRERLEEAGSELQTLLQHLDLKDAPVLVLANKQDLPDALPSEKLQTILQLNEVSLCKAFDVVALTGDGLTPSLRWLLDQLPHNRRSERLRRNNKRVK